MNTDDDTQTENNSVSDIKEVADLFWQFHNDRLANPELTDMKPYIKPLLAWRDKHTAKMVREAIDRIEQSITQHTVPEGKGLITRSYVRNTLEFERNRLTINSKEDN